MGIGMSLVKFVALYLGADALPRLRSIQCFCVGVSHQNGMGKVDKEIIVGILPFSGNTPPLIVA